MPTADRGWLSSPLHQLVAAGALAAGDPMMSWDGQGDLFYMGNNFNRGVENGVSGRFRDNAGSIWVATYAPGNPSDHSTDGSHYVRTVILAQNTFGLGSFNDKTDLTVDPVTGNVYAAWSDFHGNGCNEILFSRSTDHGATFSAPLKISSGICGNQGPSIVIGPAGQVDIGWQANTGGALAKATTAVTGAAFVSSTDFGQTFSKARIAVNYTPFVSEQFSGNGSRECGDGAFACPTGQTFPRFDLAGPYLAADNTRGTLVLGFQAAQASGQGQIEYVFSTNGGATWSSAALLAPSTSGHQFFPWLVASGGRVSAIWYDSRGDPDYAATRAPCNSATGHTSACLNVRYAESTDGGKTWGTSIQVTDTPTNLNYEQFGGRLVPFFGDYITVAAQGDSIGAVWTDQRNTVGAPDPSGDNVVVVARLCGADSVYAAAQFAATMPQEALARCGIRYNPRLGRHVPPSHKTIKRAVRKIDAKAADEQMCAWLRAEAAAGRLNWRHIAIDGKTVRGAVRPDGTQPRLLAAFDVTAGTVLGQAGVQAKTNEITCFVPLLHAILTSPRASSTAASDGSHDGDGDGAGDEEELVIVPADALHTQAGHVEAMNKPGVSWILDLKDNQPGLYALADAHPWRDEPVLHATAETGHGRHEIRAIRVTSQVPEGITGRFPGTAQMMLIERYRHQVRGSAATAACRAAGDDPAMAGCAAGAEISCETVLALTALTPAQASPAFLLARNRGHRGIENGLHHRRDTTFAEDASRLRAGQAPRLFASIASLTISVLNRAGLANHAAARRDLAWDRTGLQALGLLGL